MLNKIYVRNVIVIRIYVHVPARVPARARVLHILATSIASEKVTLILLISIMFYFHSTNHLFNSCLH